MKEVADRDVVAVATVNAAHQVMVDMVMVAEQSQDWEKADTQEGAW